MNQVFCTVFTPTFNRANLLENLYKSLLNQTFKNFEWIIVDDGSTDKTESVVQEFINEYRIKIKYLKQLNGGKHRAINLGLNYSNGSVFAIVDSDDILVENALEKIYDYFNQLSSTSLNFAGIAVNKGYFNKKLVGTTFDGTYIDAKSNERKKNNISGDKFEIFYTEVFRNYKFPSFENENFMSEVVVWTRMAKDGYYLRFYNDVLYLCDYLDDGLTKNQFKIFKKNPKGYALRIREQVKYGNINFKEKLGYYSNFYYLFKDERKIKDLINDLEANTFLFLLSIIIRKIFFLCGKGNENEYK